MDFVVVDTEGSPTLREIAVLDHQGQLLYEAFAAEHPDNRGRQRPLKAPRTIVQDITSLFHDRLVVCHHVQHDLEVLQYSFRQANLPWSGFAVACTWALAKQHLPPSGVLLRKGT